MRFGVNTWVWVSPLTTVELERLAPQVKSMGFDWIEVPLEAIGDLDYKRGAAIIRDYGLGVSACAAMGPDRDLVHGEEAIRNSGLQYIRDCVDACQLLGATNLVGPIYATVGRTWQATPDQRARETDLLVQQLTSLSAYAHDRGVVLCIEPLNRFETSFINLCAQAVEVVDRVGSPACQIMLDTFHMGIEEKHLGDAIRLAGKRLKHVHACENDRGAPGTGHIPWQDVAAGLRDIHYDGPVVIESFTSKVKSIARAAAIWRNLAPSQDALAQDGVNFLHQLLAHH
jgi:D-psicose/D-tagatose/L-ribulose 3-epimerase